MGLFKNLSKGLKKAVSTIKAAFTGASKIDIKNSIAMTVGDAAGVTTKPTLRGSNYTQPSHYFSDKEWKARKKRLKNASSARIKNR